MRRITHLSKKMSKKLGDRSELLTKDEVDRLINVVSGNLYFTTLYKVLRYSGRRIGEIYGTERNKKLFGGITLKDINFKDSIVKTNILKTKKRKSKVKCRKCGEKTKIKSKFCSNCGSELPKAEVEKYSEIDEKYMPMRKEVKDILLVYVKNYKPKLKPNDYIFRRYSLSYLKKKIKKDCERASIQKKFSLHGFRHYFVSMCKKKGMSNEDIAKWTGHTDAGSLNRYNQLTPDDVRDKIEEVEL